MAKEILFNIDARDQLKKGIDTLANANTNSGFSASIEISNTLAFSLCSICLFMNCVAPFRCHHDADRKSVV